MNIVMALPKEAAPFIRHFDLKLVDREVPFKIYSKDNMTLIISGIGKVLSAAACSYLQSLQKNKKQQAWINIGVAGHASFPIGELRRVNRVKDHATNQTYYPQYVFDSEVVGAQITTVDHPEFNYPNDDLYDMEASGFMTAALKFSTAELVGIYKVISDNRENPGWNLDKNTGDTLIGKQMPVIAEIIASYQDLETEVSHLYQFSAYDSNLFDQFHFTFTQKKQLEELLRKWNMLKKEVSLDSLVGECSSAKELLKALRFHLDSVTLSLS